jgi:hypothetical protein
MTTFRELLNLKYNVKVLLEYIEQLSGFINGFFSKEMDNRNS